MFQDLDDFGNKICEKIKASPKLIVEKLKKILRKYPQVLVFLFSILIYSTLYIAISSSITDRFIHFFSRCSSQSTGKDEQRSGPVYIC
jgi:hypothetical protein